MMSEMLSVGLTTKAQRLFWTEHISRKAAVPCCFYGHCFLFPNLGDIRHKGAARPIAMLILAA